MKKKQIRQKTVVEQLMQEIRRMITDGEYKSNQRIPTEQELAERFNVGRSSVREAVKTLSHLGVLESHTSQGTYISENNRIAEVATAWSVILGYDKMKEVFELGSALDTQVAFTLLEGLKTSPEYYAPLAKEVGAIIAHMRKAATSDDFDFFHRNFVKFFRALYEATGNMVFVSLNECIESLIVRRVCEAYYRTGKMQQAADLLDGIWKAIQASSLADTVRNFQVYGVFAYDTFASVYGGEDNG